MSQKLLTARIPPPSPGNPALMNIKKVWIPATQPTKHYLQYGGSCLRFHVRTAFVDVIRP